MAASAGEKCACGSGKALEKMDKLGSIFTND